MQAIFVAGRVFFILMFAYSGAQKLLNIADTASLISSKIVLPLALTGAGSQIEAMIGMSIPQLLAILLGAAELAAAILIAFNVGVRPMAALLVLFTAAGIYYFHDFWNMIGDERASSVTLAVRDLSVIGALLILLALGSWHPGDDGRAGEI